MKRLEPIAVLGGARTPFAKAFTLFADVSAVELGKTALRGALDRSGVNAEQIDEVVFGNVSGPPDAANIARVIALKSGLPEDRIAHTVNRNCASGMESVIDAWHSIQIGRAGLVVAGGTESMSQVPFLYRPSAVKAWSNLSRAKTLSQRLRALTSFRARDFKPLVGLELGLTDPVSRMNMGQTAELLAKEFSVSRDEQDRFALASHEKASAALRRCFLSGEAVAVETGAKDPVTKDNGPREQQSLEQLAKLRPIFDAEGSVTAGNSCPLTDGAAALVLAPVDHTLTKERAPLGYITSYAIAGCDPARMGLGPVFATAKLFRETGLRMSDFDAIELNEAFAAQVLSCQAAARSKEFANEKLGLSDPIGEFSPDKLNNNGGAIAIGHPVGATGTRMILTLLRHLKSIGGRRGLATLCVGGGQGVAVVVETELETK